LDTEQTLAVIDAKLTVRPDEELAVTENGAVPNTSFNNAAKLIVWLACVTWKLWFTGAAADQRMLPACVACTVHVPAATSVTIVPDRVQTVEVVEAKLTGRLDEAVALTANGAVPKIALDNAPKVIVWLPCVTWKLWFTGVAAAQ
jgi:hypothetical protein